MHAVTKKDPKLVSQITDMIQSGMDSQTIADNLVEQSRRESKGVIEVQEVFSDEITVSAQALAFRNATAADIEVIARLINSAYAKEVFGHEAFREGPTITEDTVALMLGDATYYWTLVEAPCGRGVEDDGTVLGVCCFTTDGISKKNGQEEGHVGAIRYIAVDPRYHGVLIGHRLLLRVEKQMVLQGCCRIMISIPEIRMSAIMWAVNRDFVDVKSVPYPAEAIGQTLTKPTCLVIFQKPLKLTEARSVAEPGLLPQSSTGLPLPPHWRMPSNATDLAPVPPVPTEKNS